MRRLLPLIVVVVAVTLAAGFTFAWPIAAAALLFRFSYRFRRKVRDHRAETEWAFAGFGLFVTAGAVIPVENPVATMFAAAAITAIPAAVCARHPNVRARLLTRRLRLQRQRDWDRACTYAGLSEAAHYTHRKDGSRILQRPARPAPRLLSATRTPAGLRLRVHMRAGWTPVDIAKRADSLAVAYGVRHVEVHRDQANAAYATILIVSHDPLAAPEPLAWPVTIEARSLWEPVAVGVDEQGRWRQVTLIESHVLLGGTTGAGKSSTLALLLAAAALDPDARIVALDGKRVELAAWEPVCDRVVGRDIDDAIDALRDVQATLDHRLDELLDRGLRKLERGDPITVLVIDELAYYTVGTGTKKQQAEFTTVLRDIVARGRAVGVIVLAATQKPEGRTVDTNLRDLFGFRIALRCNTTAASDTILGSGWAGNGADASTIAEGQKGVAYLHAEEARPVRVRCAYLDDAQIGRIVEEAVRVRGGVTMPTVKSTVKSTPADVRPAVAQRPAEGVYQPQGRPPVKRGEAQERLLLALDNRTGPTAQGDLLRAAGYDPKHRTARTALHALVTAGTVKKTSDGFTLITALPPGVTLSDTEAAAGAAERDSDGVVVYDTRFGVSPPDTPNGRAA